MFKEITFFSIGRLVTTGTAALMSTAAGLFLNRGDWWAHTADGRQAL